MLERFIKKLVRETWKEMKETRSWKELEETGRKSWMASVKLKKGETGGETKEKTRTVYTMSAKL